MRLRRRTSRRQKRDRSRDVRVRATPKSSDHHHSICLAGTSPDRSTRPTDPTERVRWRQPNPQAHHRRSGHLLQGSRCRPCCSQRAGYERSSESCVTVHRQQRTLPARQPPARPPLARPRRTMHRLRSPASQRCHRVAVPTRRHLPQSLRCRQCRCHRVHLDFLPLRRCQRQGVVPRRFPGPQTLHRPSLHLRSRPCGALLRSLRASTLRCVPLARHVLCVRTRPHRSGHRQTPHHLGCSPSSVQRIRRSSRQAGDRTDASVPDSLLSE